MSAMNVLVADDHRLFRQGLISLMNTRSDVFNVVGEAETGRQAVARAQQLLPDLVLMDIYMPDGDGLQAAETILKKIPNVAVVMLTASELDKHLDKAVQMGVSGYLLKTLDAEDLFELLLGVTCGEVAMTRSMASKLLKRASRQANPPDQEEAMLSERETQVLRLVAQGASNPQIAEELHITINTVKCHLRHILEKLKLENRTQAAAYAIQAGLTSAKA